MPGPKLNTHVKRQLKARGISFTWLAKTLGISQSHLSRHLSGEYLMPEDRARAAAYATHLPESFFRDVHVDSVDTPPVERDA